MYDLIGDIHGQAVELETMLIKLGYRVVGRHYRHENRKVIFLGDFIDRGRHQRRVLEIVRSMTENEAAYAVMGNHEYNAIAYHTPRANGGFLREQSTKNTGQHQAFLDEYASDTIEMNEMIEWFKTLPLWLDLEGIRIIHACWDQSSIDRILEHHDGSNLLGNELLHSSAERETWQFKAIDICLTSTPMGQTSGIA